MGSIKAVINQSSLASYLEWTDGKQRGTMKELEPAGKLGHFCRCGSDWTWHSCVILMKASLIQSSCCRCQTTLSQCMFWNEFALFASIYVCQNQTRGMHLTVIDCHGSVSPEVLNASHLAEQFYPWLLLSICLRLLMQDTEP